MCTPAEKKRKISQLLEEVDKLQKEVVQDSVAGWLIEQNENCSNIDNDEAVFYSGPYDTAERAELVARKLGCPSRVIPFFKEPVTYKQICSDSKSESEIGKERINLVEKERKRFY